jgi:hypothetical protein
MDEVGYAQKPQRYNEQRFNRSRHGHLPQQVSSVLKLGNELDVWSTLFYHIVQNQTLQREQRRMALSRQEN